jgi:hypothetical protein
MKVDRRGAFCPGSLRPAQQHFDFDPVAIAKLRAGEIAREIEGSVRDTSIPEPSRDSVFNTGLLLQAGLRALLPAQERLEVILPDTLKQVSRESVAKLLNKQVIRKVILSSSGREITLYEWSVQKGSTFRWVGFPTTLFTLRDNVITRLGQHANKDPSLPEYRAIEADEIEQFRLALKGQIYDDSYRELAREI